MEQQIEKAREGQNILKIPTRHLNSLVPAPFSYLIFTNFIPEPSNGAIWDELSEQLIKKKKKIYI